jgi:quinoprotein dehydrogenase-associated probable ABC transporter substrate-binding protein
MGGSMQRRTVRIAGVLLTLATIGLVAVAARSGGRARELRVCADPNNLPFSNDRREGFENHLATMIARDLGARVRYTWWAQRRGFIRNTLNAGVCDVVMGVPAGYELARTTRPYYRSTYVFLYPRSRPFRVQSFDDPVLRTLRIGVHVIGDDSANAPPAHALSRRGIVSNLVGYTIYGNYAEANPPARLVEAVAAHEIDVAIVWGPIAGYFAKGLREPLEIVPVLPQSDPALPFTYDISMGVRKGDVALQAELDRILEKNAGDIDRLLEDFGVPRVK